MQKSDTDFGHDSMKENGKETSQNEDKKQGEKVEWQPCEDKHFIESPVQHYSDTSDTQDASSPKDREEDRQNADAILKILKEFSESYGKEYSESQYAKIMSDFITDPTSDEHYQIEEVNIVNEDDTNSNVWGWIESEGCSESNTQSSNNEHFKRWSAEYKIKNKRS